MRFMRLMCTVVVGTVDGQRSALIMVNIQNCICIYNIWKFPMNHTVFSCMDSTGSPDLVHERSHTLFEGNVTGESEICLPGAGSDPQH